jgi:ATP-dependent exoDNAse (exonuclease V) alpha subunit
MIRNQFPIIPAFAMTINKSQGQSFKKVGISLANPVFAHGQLYVALSRTRIKSGIKIFVKESELQGRILKNDDRIFTPNIVYETVFQSYE